MTGGPFDVLESLLTIAGDAFTAISTSLRERRTGFSDAEAGDFLAGLSERTDTAPMPAVSPATLGFELDALPDSALLRMAAHVIEGWKPILILRDEALAATDLDEFLAVLRDRAAQFDAVEADSTKSITPENLLSSIHAAAVHQLRSAPAAAPDPAAEADLPTVSTAGPLTCENCEQVIELRTAYASIGGRDEVPVGVYFHRTTGTHGCPRIPGVDRTYARPQK